MKNNTRKTIYLDYASAAPIDKKVGKIIASYESNFFANPSAIHSEGVKARNVIEESRAQIAKLISAHSDVIFFTGSGTESDVLAIVGTITNYDLPTGQSGLQITNGKKQIPHIVTTAIEHPAVLETCKMLAKSKRAEVTYVMPDEEGLINPKDIRSVIKENTVLVSVMYANNEIGTIQPIQEIAKELRHYRKVHNQPVYPLLHTDACQMMNYLEVENIEKIGVDMMSWNSSKIYGPKGVGILFKKRSVNLAPIYVGGGQEGGLRGGTENVAGIAGSALALAETFKIKSKEIKRLNKLRDYGIKKLLNLSKISGYDITLNGSKEKRLPNNINISISDISSELLVIELDAKGILVSAKSACKSDEPDESYVISALRHAQGLSHNSTDGSLRISLGRATTKEDLDMLTKVLKDVLDKYSKWK